MSACLSGCALISMHDAITKILQDKDVDGAAIIRYDFSKAFDTLAHHRLIEKLLLLQFPTGLILWLHDYLRDRLQQVRIGNLKSKTLPVTSGAPRGSLLGPYLFLLMSHDFHPFDPSSFVCQYADDTSVVFPFRSRSDLDARMDSEMLHMQQWSASNGFRLNSAKTQCLLVCRSQRTYANNSSEKPIPYLRVCENSWCHMDSIFFLGCPFSVCPREVCETSVLTESDEKSCITR